MNDCWAVCRIRDIKPYSNSMNENFLGILILNNWICTVQYQPVSALC
nr:MAG TPA: hypothetical protein [Caudoviricetes sp.]